MTNAPSTSETILRAADALFGQRGFDGTSTREIAGASGTNLALIHYHFRGKEGLYRAVLDAHYARLAEVLARALGGEGTPRERFHAVADAYLEFLTEHRGFCLMVQREAADASRSAHIRERMRPMLRAAEHLLHEAFPASRGGALAAVDLLVSVFGVIATHVTYAGFVAELEERDADPRELLARQRAHVGAVVDALLDQAAKRSDGRPTPAAVCRCRDAVAQRSDACDHLGAEPTYGRSR